MKNIWDEKFQGCFVLFFFLTFKMESFLLQFYLSLSRLYFEVIQNLSERKRHEFMSISLIELVLEFNPLKKKKY